MTKLKLGNDFTSADGSDINKGEESDQKTSTDEVEDESGNSADSDNSKKDPEEDETEKESIDESDDEANKEENPDVVDLEDSKDNKEEKPEDKEKVLQGLLKTEKDIDKDHTDIDVAISAARKRISDKRHGRREKRDIVGTIDEKFPDDPENTDDLSDIDPTTLEVLDRFVKAKGLVPKSELAKMNYQDQHNNAQEQFYAGHKEYLPENDQDDVLYGAIKKELSLFSAPKDPKMIKLLFERAHNEVVKQYPDKFKTKIPKTDNNDNINKNVRLKTQKLGGNVSGGSDSQGESGSGKNFSVAQIRALEDGGWTQKEIEDLTK